MSSLIEGYEYDIFISYRQKDNKGDRWVSEFVEALKTELESTFKEEISVYFDINPHDGLLETHSVDRSLDEKLKCLILIPIISQTYCDSKSFAWQHELCAFNRLAKEDQFGRDIKLASGNVTSRILPVKIHDLDSDDKTLLENELGGVLRCIEFIYKSAGVNRPLRANEDHPQDNLNKTYYRDQINKVANAAKEIIAGLKKQSQHPEEVLQQDSKIKPAHKENLKTIIIGVICLLLALIVLGYFFIPKLFRSSEPLEKTIAVLPFRNLSNDTTQLYFCDGFMEEILNNLQKINSFTVRSRTSCDQYRDTKKSITKIGNELDVNYLVEGSVGREGDNIKIWVQLIDSKADKHVWSNDYIRESKQIFSLQSEIAKDIASELKTLLSPVEKELIEKTPTANLDAFYCYQQGLEYLNKFTFKTTNGLNSEVTLNNRLVLERATEQFNKALEYDTTFALPYVGLARIYLNKLTKLDSILILCDIALSFDNQLSEAYILKGYYYWSKGKDNNAIDELDRALTVNPNSWEAYYCKERIYQGVWNNGSVNQEVDSGKPSDDLHNIAMLDNGSKLPDLIYELSRAYRYAEFYKKPKNNTLDYPKINFDSARYFSHN